MSQVEIYKLRDTVSPEVRNSSVFDYMGKGDTPDPAHYIKEWAGQMHGTLPLTIPGRLMLEPPEDYHGSGTIQNGDIAVVEGQPYYFDSLQGSKFIALDAFDSSNVRAAQHIQYGGMVDIIRADAIALTDDLAYICGEIGIPCGYLGERSQYGVYNDGKLFLPHVSNESHQYFLHPDFMKGEEARAFIELLTELSTLSEGERWDGGQWQNIYTYLRERTPINLQDLQDVRERYAPELLLPAEIRSLSKHIPIDADKAEIAYLDAKASGMNDVQRYTLEAVIEAGWHCDSVAEIINLTENIDCFDLEPSAMNISKYGALRLKNDWEICERAVLQLENSENREDRFLAKYIKLLGKSANTEAYGLRAAKDDGGVFTKYGYITCVRDIEVIYRGVQDIPAEYSMSEPTRQLATQSKELPIMVQNTDLGALLLEMHAVGGKYMRDAGYNIRALANKGDDFFVMMSPERLDVSPVEFVCRRDRDEFETWMLAGASPDTRTFIISVTDRSDGRITGSIFEADLYSIQDSIREHSFHFIHLDAEMKDGTQRRFTIDEWDDMPLTLRDQVNSWTKRYDSADEADLEVYISGIRWACEENRQPATVGELLSKISAPYMAQADNPQPDMLRIAPEAAKEILAQNTADVFRLMPNDMEKLSPIDAIKVPMYQLYREFAVKLQDWGGIEKWAQRAAGDMLRQHERGERHKSQTPEH